MTKKGWISPEDFETLDALFAKMGYGGYYDFLQCLKDIASNIGAIYSLKGKDLQAWDLQDVKTIYEMEHIIRAWSNKVSTWMAKHPEWIGEILKGDSS